jgi:hypothetical protein
MYRLYARFHTTKVKKRARAYLVVGANRRRILGEQRWRSPCSRCKETEEE